MTAAGAEYEEHAAQWLEQRGWKILYRNVRFRSGELDIVALDQQQLVFVEVRKRSNPRYPSATESVDKRKQQRLLWAAASFLQRHPQWANRACRFDVIAFEPRQSLASFEPIWIRAAFTA
ncbi:YraN family protein [Parahaliea sp. F7430]|uniref:UPF0102 protein H2508_07595 n=1 Tax=Sediminihaliea albiluteola TaxID=2758564 RepID=A0A7W2YJC8_9GAMM|nr:YraN family protein [Sediminihaliea albiluteola]MBA6412972.1 YraN family protein [Sediminihaliea albiluteola]